MSANSSPGRPSRSGVGTGLRVPLRAGPSRPGKPLAYRPGSEPGPEALGQLELALSLAGHPEPGRFVAEFSGSERTVAEYLLAEVLDRQPDEVRRLLLRTSELERAQFVTSPINMVSDDLSAPPQKMGIWDGT